MSRRVAGLDGLRGIASLIVVFRHTANAVAMPLETRHALLEGPLAPLLNAQGAVQLFFVLSGWVLAASLARGSGAADVARFYVRRIFRIHPPYLAGVAFAWLLAWAYVPRGPGWGLTPWVDALNDVQVTPAQLLASLRFPGTAFGLVPQGWTLEIEMIFSLLMPLLFGLAARLHWLVLIPLSFAAWEWTPPGSPLRFAFDFSIGVALHAERERLGRVFGRLPSAGGAVLVAAGLALFGAPLLLGWHVEIPRHGILFGGADGRSMVVAGLGAGVLVAMAAHWPGWAAWLSTRPVAFLGRVSFSLYLCHWAVLSVVVTRLPPAPRPAWGWALLAAVLVTSLPVAWLGYRFVELPVIAWGRRLSGGAVR